LYLWPMATSDGFGSIYSSRRVHVKPRKNQKGVVNGKRADLYQKPSGPPGSGVFSQIGLARPRPDFVQSWRKTGSHRGTSSRGCAMWAPDRAGGLRPGTFQAQYNSAVTTNGGLSIAFVSPCVHWGFYEVGTTPFIISALFLTLGSRPAGLIRPSPSQALPCRRMGMLDEERFVDRGIRGFARSITEWGPRAIDDM